ncbi:hypothetical protein ACFY2W_27870 [Streptomyces sp. NPDC001262]|uniref:DUF7848 domain-containing protein n=1 Tax=Streptomyces sp. NPDC001262 TaxID=3364552 RepID=UPI0036AB7A6E
MTRSVMRSARWKITSVKVPGNPLMTHELVCAACESCSGPCAEVETALDWAMRHSGANPSHTGYRETARRYWRTSLEEPIVS